MPDTRLAVGALALLGVAMFAGWMAHGAPPPGTDLSSPVHQWFERQRNMRGVNCCSISDGHVIDNDEWRVVGDRYEVLINGEWHRVLPEKLRDPAGGPNPMGKAVVWYTTAFGPVMIYCFSPGTLL